MTTTKSQSEPDAPEQPAISALSASPGSVRLDGSKEFEILVNDRDFIRIPANELRSLRSNYEEFKAEALRKGYKVLEYYDPSDQSHLARFTPPALTASPPFDPPKGSFQYELASLINCHCLEEGSDTPDFILAEYLRQCLDVFDMATRRREAWYGRATTEPVDPTFEENTEVSHGVRHERS